MNELVKRLSEGKHPVEICLRPQKSIPVLKDCIARGVVHIKFTETNGGTELGVRLDQAATDLSEANLEEGFGTAKFVGRLTLNYVSVRCIAVVDLQTFQGSGSLVPLDDKAPGVNDGVT